MYEFSKKEIRGEFKATEYGKKTNQWVNISLIICIILFVIDIVLSLTLEENNVLIDIFSILVAISLALIIYFDGKRDGAIEQFKRDIKK